MIERLRSHAPFLVLLILLTAVALRELPAIPFHPDESTNLYLAAEPHLLLTEFGSIPWFPGEEIDLRTHYRMVDPPFIRYWLGVILALSGEKPLDADWDWSQTWDENAVRGAVPAPNLLLTARVGVAILIPITLTFMYLVGTQIGGRLTGWLATLYLGTHPLLLLHGRRAMSEGGLVLGVVVALWIFLQAPKRPWIVALGAAFAFSTKHSLLPLAIAGWIAVLWTDGKLFSQKTIWRTVQYFGVFALVTLVLNPVLWRTPLQTLQTATARRTALMARQTAEFAEFAPEQVLQAPTERAIIMLGHVFIAPLMYADVGNYADQTRAQEQAYTERFGQVWIRNFVGGVVFFSLWLFGLVTSVLYLRKANENEHRALILAGISTGGQIAALLLAITLPFQRYWMPVLPFVALFTAFGVSRVVLLANRRAGDHESSR